MFSVQFLLFAAIIGVLTEQVKRVVPANVQSKRWFKPALSSFPLVFGACLAPMLGAVLGGDNLLVRIELGILAGALSASAYAIIKKRALKE